jgi:hypothetical protein
MSYVLCLTIHHIQTIFTSFYYGTIILLFLQLLLAGRLLSVSCVRYSYTAITLKVQTSEDFVHLCSGV